MDIHRLELFVAVVDSPTMAQAADKAHLSTSAVSLQMKTLANELKTELFFGLEEGCYPLRPADALPNKHAT